ncbi:MAG: nucleoside deaminase [Gammaproteobacteria bacterium]|nr:nucleoside deaminase [Gammaproteobacteria bacterium]MBU1491078.1 nucleoside deaminase [Gammaproteobacteria bacterium]MBU2065841.1 nucleoside deaminase [Gammaproteobacteria bacterium]MBU2141167.1 nucleoside deaminase [Gammaproteobacteria bacterium]MBU2215755.1 nucleoside deaminase [Gammaproteobacteria bacterium]
MNSRHAALLHNAPHSHMPADTWARLCCEQALLAVEDGCYGVGAVLVTGAQELLCSARNQVFADGHYNSAGHAEMLLLDQLENEHPAQDRSALSLYVSLQPCLMCYGRILLAGITCVRYLARDKPGGFINKHLPAAWTELSARTCVRQADADPYWINLAEQAINHLQDRQALRQRVVAAWHGQPPE